MTLNLIKTSIFSILIFIRFGYQIPVVLLDDSVKYFIPLNYINTKYTLPYIFEGLNFSLFNEAISAFFQTIFSGGLSELIIFQKILGLISTVIFYLILKENFKIDENISLIFSTIFSLNPFMLYIEQAVMPESYFIFFTLIATYLFNLLLLQRDTRKFIILICLFGLTLSLISTIKETANYWNILTITLIALLSFMKFKETKKKEYLLSVILLIISSQVFNLPSRIYHLQKYSQPVDSLYSTKGVVLYSISQDMLKNKPSHDLEWLQDLILLLEKQNLERFRLQSPVINDQDKELAYSSAISRINSVGREGKLINPITRKQYNSKEWADLCIKFTINKAINNPILFIKRIFSVSFPNLFFNENYTLQFTRKSSRPLLDKEVMQFINQPFSFKNPLDPELNSSTLINYQEINNILMLPSSKRPILFMSDRSSNTAYKLDTKSFSLLLQEYCRNFGYGKIFFIPFLILSIIFLFKEPWDIKKLATLFPLISTMFFIVFPLLVSMCEARYRLQFEHFMLITIAVLYQHYKNHFSSRQK
jgi:hypothetical protein